MDMADDRREAAREDEDLLTLPRVEKRRARLAAGRLNLRKDARA